MKWGLPKDGAALAALVLGALLAIFGARAIARLRRAHLRERVVVAIFAAAAAILSSLYVVFYLRGGPRIIDATSYYLEARVLAEGHLSFPIADPSTSILGRFLVADPTFHHASVIFPPGYPALLALGFLARAPLAVGPILGAVIAGLTYDLAKRLATKDDDAASLAAVAAFLSVTCAALRYHTADTMAHGFAAALFAGAVASLFRALDGDARFAALTGLAFGALVATRPFSALALFIVLAFAIASRAARSRSILRSICLVAVFALPGVALLLAHGFVATGSVFGSAQRLYYATSDGPADCFRYGFGENVGCLHEHGDFVRANLKNGFGALAATMTTLRRLKMHLVDALDAEPLALFPLAGIVLAIRARAPAAKVFALAVAAQILVYVPFYFDGNYPGGGARFFADVLPFEHAFAAFAIVRLARRAKVGDRALAALLALPLFGFAFRASFDHAQLRDRDGGRPMFEARALAAAKIDHGLLFVDTDHGFDLAFDPSPSARVAVARRHDDASDRAIWDALGRPPAFAYRFDFTSGEASVDPIDVAPLDAFVRASTLWPPRRQRGAFAIIDWPSDACLAGAPVLAIEGRGAVDLAIPGSVVRGRTIAPRLFGPGAATLTLRAARGTSWKVESSSNGCRSLEPFEVGADETDVELTVEPRGDGDVALIRIDLGHR